MPPIVGGSGAAASASGVLIAERVELGVYRKLMGGIDGARNSERE